MVVSAAVVVVVMPCHSGSLLGTRSGLGVHAVVTRHGNGVEVVVVETLRHGEGVRELGLLGGGGTRARQQGDDDQRRKGFHRDPVGTEPLRSSC